MKKDHGCILVSGMHRSGTSFLSGCLHILGADFGDTLMQANDYNAMGYWEHNDVFAVHEQLLQDLSCAWDTTGSLPDDWQASLAGRRAYSRIREIIERSFGESPLFAVKDPRICRFMPLWREVLEDLSIMAYPVVIVRDPVEVAMSIATLHSRSLRTGRLLWLTHYRELLSGLAGKTHAIVTYDRMLDDPLGALRDIVRVLDIPFPHNISDKHRSLLRFAQPKLRHQRRESTPLGEEEQRAFASYQWLYERIVASTEAGSSLQPESAVTAKPSKGHPVALESSVPQDNAISCLALPRELENQGTTPLAGILKELFDVIGENERREESHATMQLRLMMREKNPEPFRTARFFPPDDAGKYDDSTMRTAQLLRCEWQDLRFTFSQTLASAGFPLRFYPLNVRGDVRLATLRVVNAATGEELLRLETPEDFARCPRTDELLLLPSEEGVHFVCLGTDQHFLVPPFGDHSDVPLELRVWMRIDHTVAALVDAWQEREEGMARMRDALAGQSRELEEARAANEALCQAEADGRQGFEAVRRELEEARAANEALRQAEATDAVRRKALQRALEEARVENEALRQAEASHTERIEALQHELEEARAANEALRQADADGREGFEAVRRELEEARVENEALRQAEVDGGERLEALQRELEETQSRSRRTEEAEDRAAAMEREASQLRERLAATEEELHALSSRHADKTGRLAAEMRASGEALNRLKQEGVRARRELQEQRLVRHLHEVKSERRRQALDSATDKADRLAETVAELRRQGAAWRVLLTARDTELETLRAVSQASELSDRILIEASGLFDAAAYVEAHPEARADPLAHYLRREIGSGRPPHPLFDERWYLERYPDVREAGINPLAHYLRFGAAEERDPHPLFSSAWYLSRYPDVALSGVNPLVHYWAAGALEGRDPHPLFHGEWYLARNLDVAETEKNPLQHYMEFGAAEGRDPNPFFDSVFYRAQCDESLSPGENPLLHYLTVDAADELSPGPDFDGPGYRDRYGERLKDEESPLVHYCRQGRAMGLLARPNDKPRPVVTPFFPSPPSSAPPALVAAPESHRRSHHDLVDAAPLLLAWVINRYDRQTMRYRAYNYAEALGCRQDVDTIIVDVEDMVPEALEAADVLILCRIANLSTIIPIIDRFHALGKPVVYDIDDLVFDPGSLGFIDFLDKMDGETRLEMEAMFQCNRDVMLHCDLVTVSTFALKRQAQRFAMTAHVLPNTIALADIASLDTPVVELRPKEPGSRIRLGYFSGTATHERDFVECREALIACLMDHPEAELVIMGELDATALEVFGDRLIRLPLVPHADMLRELSRVDVNLAPLELQNPFTNAKSELKVFEAALFAVPTIASPVSGYAACIRHGSNGFLAADPGQWREAMERLVTDPELRLVMGEKARQSIPRRFFANTTAEEALTLYRAARAGRLRRFAPTDPAVPAPSITVISILYNKASEVEFFLESLRRQTYHGDYEVLLIDDRSPDDGVETARRFADTRLPLPDTNPGMRLRLLANAENSGNCVSRNRGAAAADGDVLVIVDADCVFNEDFLAVHAAAYQLGDCDAAIGPMDIETGDRSPWAVLNRYEIDYGLADPEAGFQDPINPDSFVNCVTRNFSIRRAFARERFGDALFDEAFGYSAKPDSGFGWEDVELGCRLFAAGARLKYLPRTVALHVSHPANAHNGDKGLRSLRNFRRLHEKHPDLALQSRQWCLRTYKIILDWAGGETDDLARNDDYHFLDAHLRPHLAAPVVIERRRRLRILTYRWHCPVQYQLMRLDHDFTLATDGGTGLCQSWELQKRPQPACAVFRPWDQIDPRDYDVAILPFDENFLYPELGLGQVPMDWGRTLLRAMTEWDIPKVGLCLGTPQFYGQYDPDYDKPDLMQVIEKNRQDVRDVIGDMPVVYVTHQQREEWDVPKGVTIWHGFAAHEYPWGRHDQGVLSMTRPALHNRPWYNGLYVNDAVRERLGPDIPFDHLLVEAPASPHIQNTSAWAVSLYQNYVRAVGRFSIYLNPTIRSPMPWSRTEAMLTGLVSVSLRNYDVDRFIKNGVDGFYADEPGELADQIRFLMRHPAERERMGAASRRTAWRLFNQDRWLAEWSRLLFSLTD